MYYTLLGTAFRSKSNAPLCEGKDGHENVAAIGGWPRYWMVLTRLRMSAVDPGPYDVRVLSDGVLLAEENKEMSVCAVAALVGEGGARGGGVCSVGAVNGDAD